MTRLQTLRLDSSGGRPFSVELAGLLATVQRLSISRFSIVDICSWPSAGAPAAVELRVRDRLRPQDASSQPRRRGQLSGCRLQRQAAQLAVGDHHWREQVGQDAVGGLLRWVNSSQVASVVLDPVLWWEDDDEYADTFEGYKPVTVCIEHDDRWVSIWHELGESHTLQYLRRALQQQCGLHGLSCDTNSNRQSICVSRAVCQ